MKPKSVHLSLAVIMLSLTILLPACAGEQPVMGETKELSICIEQYYANDWKPLLDAFARDNPDVELEIIELPAIRDSEQDGSVEREAILNSIRVEMLAGDGPDLFLLNGYTQTGEYGTVATNSTGLKTGTEEQLFENINRVVSQGVLAALDPLLETADIRPEQFVPAIYEAGKFGDVQYLLPLSFEMTGLLFTEDSYNRTGLSESPTVEELTAGLEIVENWNTMSFSLFFSPLMAQPVLNDSGDAVNIDNKLAEFELEQNKTRREAIASQMGSFDLDSTIAERTQSYFFASFAPGGFNQLEFSSILQEGGHTPVFVAEPNCEAGTSALISCYASVGEYSRNKLNAAKMLAFLVKPENQVTINAVHDSVRSEGSSALGYIPANAEALKLFFRDDYDIFYSAIQNIGVVQIMNRHLISSYQDAAEAYYSGSIPVEQVLPQFESRIQTYLLESSD